MVSGAGLGRQWEEVEKEEGVEVPIDEESGGRDDIEIDMRECLNFFFGIFSKQE